MIGPVRTSKLRLAAAILTVTGLAGCTDPAGPRAPRTVRVDAQWVVGEAASAVDPGTGLFRIPAPSTAVLSSAAAESIAVAAIRFGLYFATVSNLRTTLEAERGAPIAEWNALLPCGRTIHAVTPFGPAPPETPRSLARFMGSAWDVTLCGPAGDPQVTYHVSDARSGVRFVGPDFVITDVDSLTQMYISGGLPRYTAEGMQPSPEAVVGALFARTGVPVRAVPRPHLRWVPPMMVARFPLWELELASPVSARFDGGEGTGPLSRVHGRFLTEDSVEFFVPSDSQPATERAPFPVTFAPIEWDTVSFAVERPVVFRRIHFR